MQKRWLAQKSFYGAILFVLAALIISSYLGPDKTGQVVSLSNQGKAPMSCTCPIWGPLIGDNECDDSSVTSPQICATKYCTNWATGSRYSCNSPVSCPTTCPKGKPAYVSMRNGVGPPYSPFIAWCDLVSSNCPATANYQCPSDGCLYRCDFFNQPPKEEYGRSANLAWSEYADCGNLPPIEY